ncbi:hypothetical protein GCM10011335_48860 [Aureimonas glaciei]|uniref:Transposase n=1 Tax=Aureimonas glaciei TaxID=1776957 RepID=A0A916YDG3_9HYPH|nr:hypothetical protein GCM10011335_48860 [Aureimonas glaciei]
MGDALISRDEAAVYRDRAYHGNARRPGFKECGVKDRIMHRHTEHMPVLPPWLKARNPLISRHRAPVESVFNAMKRIYG